MNPSLLLSQIGIRPRILGGFALILSFLVLLSGFALVQVGQIGGTVNELVSSADGDARMAQVRGSLLEANGAVERFIRTLNVGDKDAAARAIDAVGGLLDQTVKQFSNLPAIASGSSVLKTKLESYRSSFAAVASAVDRLRTASGKTEVQGAAAGLDIGGIQTALANLSDGTRLVNPMRLAASVDAVRVAVMRYTSTLSALDGQDAKMTLEYARAAIADAGPEIDQAGRGQLKLLVTALKSAIDADAVALDEVIKASGDLRSTQADLSKAGADIDKQVNEINRLLGSARAEQGEKTTAAVQHTQRTVIATAIGALVLGTVLAWLIGASVSGPIRRMTARMQSLAAGQLDETIPGGESRDEIGKMAGAVQVFKDSMIETERLRSQQVETEEREARQRKADMVRMADNFENAVGEIIETVSSASTELEASATTLTSTAVRSKELATTVAAASEEASTNVQSVASATEELTSSVNEISRQVQESARMAGEAVDQARKTNDRVGELSKAAARIGDVLELISTIAGQTNLLALNATIEAARAGEAGRGFAVVASEVKALAEQTAKATGEISQQVSGIQVATQESVGAIKEISGTIERLSEISATIASAVEEQGAATQEISRNVQQAAQGTHQVSSNITDVQRGAAETGSASSQVLSAAQSLSRDSTRLKLEVGKFLNTVRAA